METPFLKKEYCLWMLETEFLTFKYNWMNEFLIKWFNQSCIIY